MACTSYGSDDILALADWAVDIALELEPELRALPDAVKEELSAQMEFLRRFGPTLGRPRVDTLKGSRHANMKELRFSASGAPWRVMFAFDPRRCAILLVAGNKTGIAQRLFYRRLICKADDRFDAHLARVRTRS